jgi:cell division protein FtsL
MNKKIFPKEIIQFSLERHYSRFSKGSKAIYLIATGMVIALLMAIPFLMLDITVQGSTNRLFETA